MSKIGLVGSLRVSLFYALVLIGEFLKVIKTFEKELHEEGLNYLKPLKRAEKTGVADPDEVTQVVTNRSGSILSASTIIKSDFFSNLQKMTLPECVAFAPCLIYFNLNILNTQAD